jgi:hypothetical protein
MPAWIWQVLLQVWPYSLSLGLGLWLGWWWGLSTPPPPPRVNPWAGRACREWDGGERWT